MAQPLATRERVFSIDVLRGFAVLGILLMNILAFGLPNGSRMYPDILPGNTGANAAVWTGTYLLVSGVFRALFTILFGASALLFTFGKQTQLRGGDVGDLYARRMLWLVAIGLVHGFVLLGWIDVLWVYGIVGLFLYSFRASAPRRLLLIAGLLMAVPVAQASYEAAGYRGERAAAARVHAVRQTGRSVDRTDSVEALQWQGRVADNRPSAQALLEEGEAHAGGYLANLKFAARRYDAELDGFARVAFCDVAMMMFLGMALYKWGVLSAERSVAFYSWLSVLGFGSGLFIRANELKLLHADTFDPFAIAAADVSYHPGRLLVALGWIGLVMLACKLGPARALLRPLGDVGRMALTNYLLQTVVCVFVFYGFGLGLFGRLERRQLLYVVAAIWAFELLASALWLRRFRFGPVEWLWRSLTYGSRQPMRIQAPA